MRERLLLVATLFIIPLVGYGVAYVLQDFYEDVLREQVKPWFDSVPSDDRQDVETVLRQLTLHRICSEPDAPKEFGLVGACGHFSDLERVQQLAIGAMVSAVGLLVAIVLAGRMARRRRWLLLWLFRPLLVVTLFTVVAIVIVQAYLAVASIYYVIGTLSATSAVYCMVPIGGGALLGVVVMSYAMLRSLRPDAQGVIGRSVTDVECPALWNLIRDLAARMGAAQPDTVLVGLDPTYFVTATDIWSVDSRHQGRTLFLSLPLCRILTVHEFTVVIAHELAHFKGADTEFSMRFYPIYRASTDALHAARVLASDDPARLALWPAVAILSLFLESFELAEKAVTRTRELGADREAATVGGTRALATALVKIHAFTDRWDGVREKMTVALVQGQSIDNASTLFARLAEEHDKGKTLERLEMRTIPHPTDSHPTLGVRLSALKVELADVAEQATMIDPLDRSIALVPEAEAVEEALTASYHRMLTEDHYRGKRLVAGV